MCRRRYVPAGETAARTVTMINDVQKDLSSSIGKAHEALKRELLRLRAGRASAALLEGIKVDYYGTPTPLAADGPHQRTGAASHHGQAVGQDADQGGRQGPAGERPRPEPADRWRPGPHPASSAHRRAPQGVREGRAQIRRRVQGGHPQSPPRRPRPPGASSKPRANRAQTRSTAPRRRWKSSFRKR